MKVKRPISAANLPRLSGGRGRNSKPVYVELENKIVALSIGQSLPVEYDDEAERTRTRTAMSARGRKSGKYAVTRRGMTLYFTRL